MPPSTCNHKWGKKVGGVESMWPFILYLLSLCRENKLTDVCILKYCSEHLKEKQRSIPADTNSLLCLRKLLMLSYPTSPTLRLLRSTNYLFIGTTGSMHHKKQTFLLSFPFTVHFYLGQEALQAFISHKVLFNSLQIWKLSTFGSNLDFTPTKFSGLQFRFYFL